MRFIDEVKVRVRAGNGGNGGDVCFEATERKHTLLDFRYRHLFAASSGKHGQGKNRHGRTGANLVLAVPVGTLVKVAESGEVLADLAQPGQCFVAAKGGLGGRGNARFATATRQVPRFAEDGREGEEQEYVLELKLLADVGLVGLPNAGKSTLIAAVSAAQPKIADYPFTTLVPNLGVVQYGEAEPFVMADVPGLIEGAHRGAGLGTRFLRHLERTRILVHLIDMSQLDAADPLRPYRQIEHELASHSDQFADKARIIALNKTDLLAEPQSLDAFSAAYRQLGHPVVLMSALRRAGLQELLKLLVRLLSSMD